MKPTKDNIFHLDENEVKLFEIMLNKKMSEKFDWFIGSELGHISFVKYAFNTDRNYFSITGEVFVDEKWGRQQVDDVFGKSEELSGFGLGDIIETELSLEIQAIMRKVFGQVTGETPKLMSFSWIDVIFVEKPKKGGLKEETDNTLANKLRTLAGKIGLNNASKTVGGMNNYIQVAYDGDIKEFYKNENISPYYIKSEDNPPNMYFDDTLVQYLNLEDFGKDEKKLGKFKFGKNVTQYSFDARLRKINYANGKAVWKVVGMSGSSGFGYSFINKRETLGKTYRLQIFRQIIDKYNLNSF